MTEAATFVGDRLLRVGNTEFHCDFDLAVVRRGEDVVDPEAIRLADLVHDHHGFAEATH